jgi:hypothetical protein
MNYTEKTPSYNERRYGKPWMAIVTTSMTKDFSFIDWDGRPGSVGEFNFDAAPGTLLAYGQKDIRKGRGGVDGYQICMPDGSMPAIGDSLAQDLRKLPVTDRSAVAAARIIAAKKAKLAEYSDKQNPYYIAETAKLAASIEHYRTFLPTTPAAAVIDLAGFGF